MNKLLTKQISFGGSYYVTVPVAEKPTAISQADWLHLSAINDYIIDRVSYDNVRAAIKHNRPSQTPHDTLRRGRGVCSDYAALFEKIARQEGFTARSVISDRLNHAWNEINLAGSWWIVDVTWNDGEIFSTGRRIPKQVTSDPDYRKRYFLTTVTKELLLCSHGLLTDSHYAPDQRPVDYGRTWEAMWLTTKSNEAIGKRNQIVSKHNDLLRQKRALIDRYNKVVELHNAAQRQAVRKSHRASLDRLQEQKSKLDALISNEAASIERLDKLIGELKDSFDKLVAAYPLAFEG